MGTKTFRHTIGGGGQHRSFFVPNPTNWSYAGFTAQTDNTVSTGPDWVGWAERIAACLTATTAMTVSRIYSTDALAVNVDYTRRLKGALNQNNDVRYQYRGSHGWFSFSGVPGLPTISLNRANAIAMTKFVERAKSLQRTMQGGVFIGEIHEALSMIRNPFKILYKNQFSHIQSVVNSRILRRMGRAARPRAIRKVVADSWLEASFGWRPLLNDIDDGVHALAELSARHADSQCVSSRGLDQKAGSPFKSPFSAGNLAIDRVYTTTEEASVRYRGAVAIEPPSFKEGLHRFGISFADILPTAWELIPYSFLVDYFTNLGSIIEAATFNSSSVRWVWKGTRVAATQSVDFQHTNLDTPPPGYYYEVVALSYMGNLSITNEIKTRSDFSGQSWIPPLVFKIPGMSLKWLNLAALGVTHARGSRSVYGS
jgi:hypothetical protein